MDEITIRRVVNLEQLHKVYQLTHDSFVAAGLCDNQPHRMIIHHPNQDVIPDTYIFLAEINDVAIGSVSFTVDSEFGLMMDAGFKEQVDRYRKYYGKLAAFWRMIILPQYQSDTRVFRRLVGAAAMCLLKHQIPVCFFTFSPEHARIYQRVFHTEEVCWGKDSNELIKSEHSDVVLVKLYPDKLPEKWFSITEEEILV